MKRSSPRWLRVAAVALAVGSLVVACSGRSTTGGGSGAGQVTLTINFWGDFGLQELKTRYEAEHTNVKIALNSGEYNAQHEDLQKKLIAGSGAPDIAAIDEGFMVQFRSQADQFVNLLDKGAGRYESNYLPWKWKQSLSADGKTQIALGTDVGGLAMCYRTDLFAAAGLPTERDQVSALWPTWDDFISVGQRYVAETDKKFLDNATNLFNPILGQQPVGFYDPSEQLQMQGGPKVAFDYAVKAVEAGLSANLTSFQADWDKGFTNGSFAVLACPAWMLGHIQNTAPATSGKWDIAAVPGGGGNWGGSFLTIPKQGRNVDEAYKFLEWLVQPEQQIEVFKTVGNLPSQPGLYRDPAIADFKNEFFNSAPVGQIFPKMAEGLTPQYLGRKNGPTRVAVENVINRVQNGTLASDAAWAEAIKEAEKAGR
ncbi:MULTISPECIES: ABC transporter substrate-binding protein [Micromonospora]|uniref:ABC transporter substrate-binding protein n=1 Tax=Micromonospora maris TaxID=1003110 RepID=A0A9X0LFM9_9ACTN|nr:MULTISPECIES: extracellular solute-binding protein [Micromonospora]AEB43347.1 extracellular solute-binding protein family 1 [Micromonospora maris AB-18-032]KUJ48679.1 ABC transporter substrate-binding protein [Micromonospora maris]RUL93022.1 extracellular solute-binding protein [Verrucosispora sp. FIM060022]